MPRAFITGITGQDGSYLAELLLEKDYEVHGMIRGSASLERSPLKSLCNNAGIFNRRLFFHSADLTDSAAMRNAIRKAAPDEVYHLASQSHVGSSFEKVELTCQTIALGTSKLLELFRDLPKSPRFFHASSSEVFGQPDVSPQDESTPFKPTTPYGCAKVFATEMVSIYRQTFGVFACNGILYNHESPRRGENFVTQKICRAAAAIKQGRQQDLSLGDISLRRDWGDARDYVRAMWLMLQQPVPEDFILATGKLHSVQETVEIAFKTAGLNWRDYVRQDPGLLRPNEPSKLVGNPAKAGGILNWRAETAFEDMIEEMTRAALAENPIVKS